MINILFQMIMCYCIIIMLFFLMIFLSSYFNLKVKPQHVYLDEDHYTGHNQHMVDICSFNLDIMARAFTYILDDLICPLDIGSPDQLVCAHNKSHSLSLWSENYFFSVLLWSFLPFFLLCFLFLDCLFHFAEVVFSRLNIVVFLG